MIPFLQAERERLQRADTALGLIQRKLRILKEMPADKPYTTQKIEKNVETHYQEYEAAKAELLRGWESEETWGNKRVDMVTVAEDHNWHPHETIY